MQIRVCLYNKDKYKKYYRLIEGILLNISNNINDNCEASLTSVRTNECDNVYSIVFEYGFHLPDDYKHGYYGYYGDIGINSVIDIIKGINDIIDSKKKVNDYKPYKAMDEVNEEMKNIKIPEEIKVEYDKKELTLTITIPNEGEYKEYKDDIVKILKKIKEEEKKDVYDNIVEIYIKVKDNDEENTYKVIYNYREYYEYYVHEMYRNNMYADHDTIGALYIKRILDIVRQVVDLINKNK